MAKNMFIKSMDNNARSTTSIAFVHHKGGTGKTTACLNIAGWLARVKKKCWSWI